MHIKVTNPPYADGVRLHNTGDVLELSETDGRKYVRRGWGEEVKPSADTKSDEKKGKGGK